MYVYVVYDIQVFLILLLSVLIRHNTITNKACYGQEFSLADKLFTKK